MRRKPQCFRPCIHALEERVNLSFSLSTVVHSLFPFVPDNSNKVKHTHAVVRTHVPTVQKAAHPRAHAAKTGHPKVMGQPSGPAISTTTHLRGVYNVYVAKTVAAIKKK